MGHAIPGTTSWRHCRPQISRVTMVTWAQLTERKSFRRLQVSIYALDCAERLPKELKERWLGLIDWMKGRTWELSVIWLPESFLPHLVPDEDAPYTIARDTFRGVRHVTLTDLNLSPRIGHLHLLEGFRMRELLRRGCSGRVKVDWGARQPVSRFNRWISVRSYRY